jgi:hypothetical protein
VRHAGRLLLRPNFLCRRYLPWAHAKGLLHFDSAAGLWLRHSLPKFPNQTTTGSPGWRHVPWPETCLGQHALCLSLGAAELDGAVAPLLSKFKPYFYQVGWGWAASGRQQLRAAPLNRTVQRSEA